jgi:hypothetical protein
MRQAQAAPLLRGGAGFALGAGGGITSSPFAPPSSATRGSSPSSSPVQQQGSSGHLQRDWAGSDTGRLACAKLVQSASGHCLARVSCICCWAPFRSIVRMLHGSCGLIEDPVREIPAKKKRECRTALPVGRASPLYALVSRPLSRGRPISPSGGCGTSPRPTSKALEITRCCLRCQHRRVRSSTIRSLRRRRAC